MGIKNIIGELQVNGSPVVTEESLVDIVPDEIYIGNGDMPEGATVQILMDGSDEELALKDELKEYIDGELEEATVEAKALIADELAKRMQLTPEFANSIDELEESGDTTKLYVLPDGYIYANQTATETKLAYTNLAVPDTNNTTDDTKWVNNKRFGNGYIASESGKTLSNPIPIKQGDVVRVKGVSFVASSDRVGVTTTTSTAEQVAYVSVLKDEDNQFIRYKFIQDETNPADTSKGIHEFTLDMYGVSGPERYKYFRVAFNTPSNPENVIITVNEQIIEEEITATTNKWINTDIKFISMDTNDPVIQEIIREESQNQLSSIQLTYEYVDSIDKMIDQTKPYVLTSDYHIYAWMYTEVTTEGTKNLLENAVGDDHTTPYNGTGYKDGARLSSSGAESTLSGAFLTGFIPVKAGGTVYLNGDYLKPDWESQGSANSVIYYSDFTRVSRNGSVLSTYNMSSYLTDGSFVESYVINDEGYITQFTLKSDWIYPDNWSDVAYIRMTLIGSGDGCIITNTPIVEGGTEQKYAWTDTGRDIVPADCEPTIIELANDIQSLQNDVDKIEEQIEQGIGSAISSNIPTHWQEAIKSASERIKAVRDAGGVNCVDFLWTTDIHAIEEKPSTLAFTTNKTMNEIGKLFGHIAKTMMDRADIPLFVATGDLMSQNSYTSTANIYSELALLKRWLNPIPYYQQALIMGNHDGAWGNTTATEDAYKNQLPLNEMYNLIYRKQAMDLRRVSGDNGTYYYIDNVPQKMRFIMLNTNNTPDYEALSDGKAKYNRFAGCCCQAQLDWLTNVALNMPDGYTACIFGHEPYPNDWVQMVGIVDAYNKRASFKNTYTHSEDTWRNSTVDVNFANAKGEISAVFAGHVHYDYIRNNENNPMYATCPLITMTTSLGGRIDRELPNGATQPSRSEDNATEFAMDIVTVDTKNRKIYMTRLGGGADREVSYKREN